MTSRPKRSGWTATVTAAALLLGAVALYLAFGGRPSAPGQATSTPQPSAQAREETARHKRAMRAGHRRGAIELPKAEAADSEGEIGAIEGRVVSATSLEGIPRARVQWSSDEDDITVTTDERGAFRFEPPAEGEYRVVLAERSGFTSRSFEATPLIVTAKRGAGLRGLEIALDPQVKYRGLVVGPEGEPIAGASVTVLEAEAASVAPGAGARTDDGGRFELILPDDALVEARHSRYAPGRARVDIGAQISRTITIRLGPISEEKPSSAIAGYVRNRRGDPIEGASVIAAPHGGVSKTDLSPVGRATTDASGAFTVDGLDAGAYTLTASKEELASATLRSVDAPAKDVVLEMGPGGSIQGSVKAIGSGEPVTAFTIVLYEKTGPLTREVVATEPFLDDKGGFFLANVPAGTFEVTALARGFGPATDTTITVREEDAEPATVELEVPDGAAIAGVVTSGDAGPFVKGARITLEGRDQGPDGSVPFVVSAVTDARGGFALAGLALGTATLFAAAEGHHAKIVPGVSVPGVVTIALTPLAEGETPKIELFGIGAVLKAEGEVLVVQAVVASGGAAEAGIVAGDGIVAIDGVNVVDLGFAASIEKIRGPEGTSVSLKVRRGAGGSEQVIAVRRLRVRA